MVTVKSVFRAEKYILWHDRLLWLVLVMYCAVGGYAGFYDHAVMDTYKGVELFSLPEIMGLFLSFSTVMLTGYVIGGDFSRRTIQNVLSVGIDKKTYYYSRLLAQGLLTGALFTGIGLIHIYCRPPGFTVMPSGKYLAGGLQSGSAANLIGVQYNFLT